MGVPRAVLGSEVQRARRTIKARKNLAGRVRAAVRPVPGEPALWVGTRSRVDEPYLVIADLHLGLAATRDRPLGPPESSAPALAEALIRLARREEVGGLVIAGDAKHPIVGAPPLLRRTLFDFFAELLRHGLSVEVVLGNHDVGLARCLPREVDVRSAKGIVRNGVGIFHGHTWPSATVLRAERLVVGHLHPGVRFAPTRADPGGKRRCWLRIEFDEHDGPRRGRRRISAREMVVLPAYNPVAGTEALNRERPGRGRSFLYRRFLAHGTVRAYLLDGTDVGSIRLPRPAPRGQSRKGANSPP
ncbi:MAG: metallophosphoesterase [Thermoplasmata archaeon]